MTKLFGSPRDCEHFRDYSGEIRHKDMHGKFPMLHISQEPVSGVHAGALVMADSEGPQTWPFDPGHASNRHQAHRPPQ